LTIANAYSIIPLSLRGDWLCAYGEQEFFERLKKDQRRAFIGDRGRRTQVEELEEHHWMFIQPQQELIMIKGNLVDWQSVHSQFPGFPN
jgi:hypothetical protein